MEYRLYRDGGRKPTYPKSDLVHAFGGGIISQQAVDCQRLKIANVSNERSIGAQAPFEKTMVYAILTTPGKDGMPFKQAAVPPTAPGDPLVLSEHATLVGFVKQPDRVFARKSALAYGCMMWYLTEDVLERNDLEPEMEFSSYREFETWLRNRENPKDKGNE